MPVKAGRFISYRCALLSVIALYCVTAANCFAGVKLPNGEYQVTVDDLSVKALGGSVTISRTWQATDQNHGVWQWLFTPEWSDLVFTFDSIDGSVKSIQRAESTFTKAGTDVFAYGSTSEKQTFVKKTDNGWRWYDTFGNWMTYDANGKLNAFGDRNNVTVHFVRDGQGNISQITDNANRILLTYHYSNNLVTSISDYSGRSVTYTYSGNQLTRVTDALGNDWLYGYTSGLLTSQSDPEHGADSKTVIAYSGNRVVSITDQMGYVTTYSYDFDRSKQIYTVVRKEPAPSSDNPNGVRVEDHFNVNAKLIYEMVGTRVVQQLVKDGTTASISIDERGMQTRSTLDSQTNPITVTYPDGTVTNATFDSQFSDVTSRTDELGVQTTYEYDSHGNLVKKTEGVGKPEQRVTLYSYDSYGQRLTRTVKGFIAPTGVTPDPSDTQYQDASTTWTYDQHGNIATETDAVGHITSFPAYDVAGNVFTKKDARGYTSTYTYDARGLPLTKTDPLLHTIVYGYDKVGNRTSLTDAQNHTTTFAYDKNNRLISISDPPNDDGSSGGVSTFAYFNDGRIKQKCDQLNVCNTYQYDADGRLIAEVDASGNNFGIHYGDSTSGLAGLIDKLTYPTYSISLKYDARDRATQNIRSFQKADGTTAQETLAIGYDAKGNRISLTDPLGHTQLATYDALGQEVEAVDSTANKVDTLYDPRGNIIAVTDADNHQFKFSYDLVNLKRSASRPLGGATSYDYDEMANLTTETSANGGRHVYTYDSAGRRTNDDRYVSGASSPSQSIIYSYDERGLLTGYIQTGDTQSSATYAFNSKGLKTNETVTFGSGAAAFSRSIKYDYYGNGLKQFFTYPDNTVVTYSYASNNLVSATAPDGNVLAFGNFVWGTASQVQISKVVRNITFDGLKRPLEIRTQTIGSGSLGSPAGPILIDFQYSFDARGNILGKTTQDGDYDYGYDALNRLKASNPPLTLQGAGSSANLPVEQYSYDGAGNRISSQHQPGPWTYDANGELLSYGIGANQKTLSFDANGNVSTITTGDLSTPSEVRVLSHDVGNQLTSVQDNGSLTATYEYDPFGRRIQKKVGDLVTWYQYGDEGIVAEYSQTGSLQRAYGWRQDRPWGTDPLWLATVSGSVWNVDFYQNDYLGSPQILSDASGQVVWSRLSEAFGNAVESGSVSNAIREPGQYADSETGFYQNFHRVYDPTTGRYLERDAIFHFDVPNDYIYANADPSTTFDELGLTATGMGFPPGVDIPGAAQEAIAKLKACKECVQCKNVAPSAKKTYCIDDYQKQDIIDELKNIHAEYNPQQPRDTRGYDTKCAERLGNTIAVYPSGVKGECCSMATLLAHEAGHLANLASDVDAEHLKIFYYEKVCFGCDIHFAKSK